MHTIIVEIELAINSQHFSPKRLHYLGPRCHPFDNVGGVGEGIYIVHAEALLARCADRVEE
jgi:hypothetical protein